MAIQPGSERCGVSNSGQASGGGGGYGGAGGAGGTTTRIPRRTEVWRLATVTEEISVGSGGGNGDGYGVGGAGGGAFAVVSSIVVDGTISMNGEASTCGSSTRSGGGGSGGGILLVGDTVAIDATAILEAIGGEEHLVFPIPLPT